MISGPNQTLPGIFGNSFFRIPDYQRGYAWTDKQLNELWEDLEDIQQDPNTGDYRPHYTGMLSLKAIPKSSLLPEEQTLVSKNAYDFYDVVDGQQRLTTLLILLFVLGKQRNKNLIDNYIRIGKKNTIYRFCYGQSNSHNNNDCLKGAIFDDPLALPYARNVYTNNLVRAKAFFQEKVEALRPQKREELISKLLKALQFDIKVIDDDYDVQVVFETMNNRGKDLTILEKLKNRLMFLASKLSRSSSLPSQVNKSWGIIYEYLGKKSTMMDEDEFLSSHLTLIREPADYSFSVKDAERKVFEMFCSRSDRYNYSDRRNQSNNPAKEPSVSDAKISEYASDIARFVPFWFQVDNLDLTKDLDKQMCIIKCMNNSKEMRIFLAQMASMAGLALQDVLDCLSLVERILFINRLPIRDKVIDERRFATFARDLHTKQQKIKQLTFDLNQLLSTLPLSVSSISSGFKGLFEYVYGNKGYYRWNGLKYFLYKYEEEIHRDKYSKEFPILNWATFDETSIEHIFPQDTSNWQQELSAYFNGKTQFQDQDEKKKAEKILINTLGNLTLLHDIKNPSLGNASWTVKQKAYSSGCFMEKEISKKPDWEAKRIYERGKQMLDYMKKLVPVLNSMNDPGDYETLLFCDQKYLP